MITINELYKNFLEKLKTIYDERESANITDWVFENAGIKRLDRITNKEKPVDISTIQQINESLKKLLEHLPVQYLLGEAWFYKMKLKVNEHVLIPRPETEELVEWAVEDIRSMMYDVRNAKLTTNHSPFTILDIGTGSGCIAVALKKELSDAEIFAIDVSKDALHVAEQNAQNQDVNINFLEVDFLNEKSWVSLPSFDIIVSNPPYIPENEKCKLAKNVVDYEPHIALFVTENDPFIFYKKIASFAESHLNENACLPGRQGKVFVEVHEDYSKEVEKVFAKKNFKTDFKKDIYGRVRMVKAYK